MNLNLPRFVAARATAPRSITLKPVLAASVILLSALASAGCQSTAPATAAACGDATASTEARTADGKIIRVADDGTLEECNPAPAGGNRPGFKAVNTVCPIVDADGADESVTAEWRGKTIAFCCPTCLRQFNRMSDPQKDAMLVKATTYATP
ncbi:MAG: hypothetical protein KF724_09050 [Phycisphaeraceae bacterium]|nr:hypothetical protein [Phycisphaeraceae bacterium]